jgi:hypothetical protein
MGGVMPRLALGYLQSLALATDRTTNGRLPSTRVNVDKRQAFPAKDRAKAFVMHERSPQ